MTQLLHNIFCVEVPDDAQNLECCPDEVDDIVLIYQRGKNVGTNMYSIINLPPGTWTFLFTTNGATEEQWAQVVDSIDSHGRGLIFINYENGMYLFSKASSSGRSLLRSKGCNTERNYAILKLNDNGTE